MPALRHSIVGFILVLLGACHSLPTSQFIPKTPLIEADATTFSQAQLTHIAAINAFHQSDYSSVKSAYFEKIHQIDQLASDEFCGPRMLQLVNQALQIHPTSIVAHSYMRGCGERLHNPTMVTTSDRMIKAITEIMFANGAGNSFATSIKTREPYELKYMLQWDDVEVFDVEMVPTVARNYFLNHAIDTVDGHYIYFYSDIAQVFGATMYSLTGFEYQPSQLSTMLRAEFVRSREPTAKLWLLRQALYQGRDYQVVETLKQQTDLSPVETILLSQAYFNQGDQQSVDKLSERLTMYAQAGVVDAQLLLTIQTLDFAAESTDSLRTLLNQQQVHFGLAETVTLWSRILLAQKSLSDGLMRALGALDSPQKVALNDAFTHIVEHYPNSDTNMQHRTELLVASIRKAQTTLSNSLR